MPSSALCSLGKLYLFKHKQNITTASCCLSTAFCSSWSFSVVVMSIWRGLTTAVMNDHHRHREDEKQRPAPFLLPPLLLSVLAQSREAHAHSTWEWVFSRPEGLHTGDFRLEWSLLMPLLYSFGSWLMFLILFSLWFHKGPMVFCMLVWFFYFRVCVCLHVCELMYVCVCKWVHIYAETWSWCQDIQWGRLSQSNLEPTDL